MSCAGKKKFCQNGTHCHQCTPKDLKGGSSVYRVVVKEVCITILTGGHSWVCLYSEAAVQLLRTQNAILEEVVIVFCELGQMSFVLWCFLIVLCGALEPHMKRTRMHCSSGSGVASKHDRSMVRLPRPHSRCVAGEIADERWGNRRSMVSKATQCQIEVSPLSCAMFCCICCLSHWVAVVVGGCEDLKVEAAGKFLGEAPSSGAGPCFCRIVCTLWKL
eukprot:6467007-Amphidinium_carterae.1